MGKRKSNVNGAAQKEALRGQKALEELWRQTGRPVCKLSLSNQPTTLFDSRIGGVPYCPHDGALPVGKNGEPLRLIAQINFAQMPTMHPFPDSGMLQLFLPDHDPLRGYQGMECWTEQQNWKVIYYSDLDSTVTEEEVAAKQMIGLGKVAKEGEVSLHSNILLNDIVYKLHFGGAKQEGILGTEGMTLSDYRFQTQFQTVYQKLFPDAAPIEFCPKRPEVRPKPIDWILADEIWEKLRRKAYAKYPKLGGFPTFTKSDPRTVLPEVTEEQCPWDTVLLQVDSLFLDINNPLCGYSPLTFGPDGIATFFIQEEDLLRRDFSRVGYYWTDDSDNESFQNYYGPEWQPSERHKLFP